MECSKKVNGECGKALNCVWCPKYSEKAKDDSRKEVLRKEAIENHRKMWNWIADNQEKLELPCTHIKYEYLERYENRKIKSGCYLCDYKENTGNKTCDVCPLDWGNDSDCPCLDSETENEKGLFSRWLWCDNFHKAAELAREIANLPERVIE